MSSSEGEYIPTEEDIAKFARRFDMPLDAARMILAPPKPWIPDYVATGHGLRRPAAPHPKTGEND